MNLINNLIIKNPDWFNEIFHEGEILELENIKKESSKNYQDNLNWDVKKLLSKVFKDIPRQKVIINGVHYEDSSRLISDLIKTIDLDKNKEDNSIKRKAIRMKNSYSTSEENTEKQEIKNLEEKIQKLPKNQKDHLLLFLNTLHQGILADMFTDISEQVMKTEKFMITDVAYSEEKDISSLTTITATWKPLQKKDETITKIEHIFMISSIYDEHREILNPDKFFIHVEFVVNEKSGIATVSPMKIKWKKMD